MQFSYVLQEKIVSWSTDSDSHRFHDMERKMVDETAAAEIITRILVRTDVGRRQLKSSSEAFLFTDLAAEIQLLAHVLKNINQFYIMNNAWGFGTATWNTDTMQLIDRYLLLHNLSQISLICILYLNDMYGRTIRRGACFKTWSPYVSDALIRLLKSIRLLSG